MDAEEFCGDGSTTTTVERIDDGQIFIMLERGTYDVETMGIELSIEDARWLAYFLSDGGGR